MNAFDSARKVPGCTSFVLSLAPTAEDSSYLVSGTPLSDVTGISVLTDSTARRLLEIGIYFPGIANKASLAKILNPRRRNDCSLLDCGRKYAVPRIINVFAYGIGKIKQFDAIKRSENWNIPMRLTRPGALTTMCGFAP